MSAYRDSLAKVGLHPDNPDAMRAQLALYLRDPVKFKQADRNWRGARDSKTWWLDPSGKVALLQWPFHGGKWLDAAPDAANAAQVRAVFGIPSSVPVKNGLAALYHFPVSPNVSYRFDPQKWDSGGGFGINVDLGGVVKGIQDGARTLTSVANTLHIPGVNLATAILTGQDPATALKMDLDSFAQAANIAKGVMSGDLGPLSKAAADAAKSLGVTVDPKVAANIAAAAGACRGGKCDPAAVAAAALGPHYEAAWKLATDGGTILSKLPTPPGLHYDAGANARANPLTALAATHPVTTAQLQKTPLQVPVDKAALAAHLGVSAAHPAVAGAPDKLKVDSPWLHVAAGTALGGIGGAMLGAATVATGGLAAVGAAAGYGAWKWLKKRKTA